MRQWASGVTVVTTLDGERPHGMTVSAFSSVSAEPALVLVCLHRESLSRDLVTRSGVFAVHILGREQRELAERFSVAGNEAQRFEGLSWRRGESGAPLLQRCLARLECRLDQAYDAGSHTVFIGSVLDGEFRSGEPLLYFDGDYRAIAPNGR